MSTLRSAAIAFILAGITAALVLSPTLSRSPASLASLALGTDDAYLAFGLEPRENQIGGGAIRWTRPKAAFQFESLGPGEVDVEVEIRDHRSEVTITANGARIGSLLPGMRSFASKIRLGGSALTLGLETSGFAASGGRVLGTQLVSIRVRPSAAPGPGPLGIPRRVWLVLGAVLVVATSAMALSGLSPALSALPPLLFLVMVLPEGLWRSGWLERCAGLVACATVLSALVSARARGTGVSRGCLQAALLLALTVHGVLPPSPLVIQGDVQLHGNKLMEVAQGNRFPTSRTDHKPPFEIPYGFSFYAILAPWASSGPSSVAVVRVGAALSSALSVLALAWLLGRSGAGLAAAAVMMWALAPVNIRTMGFGNLSNVFAQSVFLLFLVAAGLMPKGFARSFLLTLLVAVSATAHLSSFIVIGTLVLIALFISSDRHSAAFRPGLAGLLLAGAYFSSFVPMIVAQAPRLLGERGGSSGVFDPWRLPAQIVAGAGWPLLALMTLAILTTAPRPLLPLSRSLATTGVLLALAALVSPVEVRYLLAVLPLLATGASSVFDDDLMGAFPRPTLAAVVDVPGLRLLGSEFVSVPVALSLIFAALVQGVRVLLEFMPLFSV